MSMLYVGNSSVVKIYIIRPKPGPVAKNATPRPSGWESNPRPLRQFKSIKAARWSECYVGMLCIHSPFENQLVLNAYYRVKIILLF